jgi:dihydroorotase
MKQAREVADATVPQILELKDRGVWTQGEGGTTHTEWAIVKKAADQGWFPDAIGTDIARLPDRTPSSVLVPMTAYLHFGLSLERVIERVTSTPAKMLNYPEKVGTLAVGSAADIAILELAKGNFEFVDGTRPEATKITASRQFVCAATVKSGNFVKGAPAPA